MSFRIDEVRLPDGKTAIREYLDHPGAVAVVPILDDGRVLMVRQFRYPVGEMTWEVPAGKLTKGEKPEPCVLRELEEETGRKAGRVRKLISYWPTSAFANEIIHIYVADKLTKGRMNPDEDEFIDCRAWELKRIYRQIEQGKIRDSKTLIALLAYRQFGRR
ncbi:MAG: NUDIX hydrolase [Elusimicrobia bacterium]|nr:NUDIX hydrolase [Elusimicrobiota bacterium]